MAHKRREQFPIVPATLADLDEIMEIERLGFASPWSRQVFVEEFDQPHARILLARDGHTGRGVGFINFWLVHDEVHILNVSTHPDYRRRGLAWRLMERAVETGRRAGARLMTLEVRRGNSAAVALYLKMGFRHIDVRRAYYEDGEDALVMLLDL